MQCQKCQGLMAIRWDVALQHNEQYCIICGFNPYFEAFRGNNIKPGEKLPCRRCHRNPRADVTRGNTGKQAIEVELCTECRIDDLFKKRRADLTRKQCMGNVRSLSHLDVL